MQHRQSQHQRAAIQGVHALRTGELQSDTRRRQGCKSKDSGNACCHKTACSHSSSLFYYMQSVTGTPCPYNRSLWYSQ